MRGIAGPSIWRGQACLLALVLAACHQPRSDYDPTAGPVAEVAIAPERADARYSACAPSRPSRLALARALGQGTAEDHDPLGACLASAARAGSTMAALTLGDSYRDALAGEGGLGRDLFGREVFWYRMAAGRGSALAELNLGRELDTESDGQMSDNAVSYYLRAARHGQEAASRDLVRAYESGRVDGTRIAELHRTVAQAAARNPRLRGLADKAFGQNGPIMP